MGRPRSFSEEAVLKAATAVFVRGGYEGTSIDDLVQALNLHRGSLYKAFGSKHGLFLAVLRHYVETQLPDAINAASTSADSHTDVAALLDSDILDLLLVAALERGHLDVEVASLVRRALTSIENLIETATKADRAPRPANLPTRALGLIGIRLHQRLRDGPDEPSAPPRIPAHSTTKGELMATISIDGDTMRVAVQGLDRLWTLTSQLTIPLAHVRGATVDPGIAGDPKGWRGPGAHIPGVIVAGTFHQDGKLIFWDVRDTSKAVVIELEDDTYQRLVVEVSDPRATVELIEHAVARN